MVAAAGVDVKLVRPSIQHEGWVEAARRTQNVCFAS